MAVVTVLLLQRIVPTSQARMDTTITMSTVEFGEFEGWEQWTYSRVP